MIKPQEFEIGGKTYILSKFPATDGREIVTQYVASGLPKIGDYKRNEELMFKLMCFVAVKTDTGPLMLTTKALVNNHIEDWETLGKIEWQMMDYNCSFFRDGRASTFLDGFAQTILAWATKMWTVLSQRLSPVEKQL